MRFVKFVVPLSDAEPDPVARRDLGEADVGPLGEQAMVLDHRPHLLHGGGRGVLHEEHHVLMTGPIEVEFTGSLP